MGAGFKAFTAASLLTAADMNNYLMEQTVMVFATTAARDSAITAPEAGMTVYINSGDANEGLYSYTGTTWNKGPSWNSPWGLLASGVSSGNTAIGADQDLTGMTATFNFIANRNIELRSQVVWGTTNGATVNYYQRIFEGATLLSALAGTSLTFSNGFGWAQVSILSHWLNPTAGSHTYKVRGAYFGAGGTGVVSATESSLRIIDHGPSGAPN